MFSLGTRKITNLVFRGQLLQNTSLFSKYSTKPCVGFIGLGNMGGHMASNLIQKGKYNLVVFDVNEQSVNNLVSQGATKAYSPKEVAQNAETIITMLPSSPHVKNVYLGKDGILSAMKPGTLCIDSSTIDPIVTKEVGKEIENNSGRFVDAPVSGGVLAAQSGTLTFMCGGSEENFKNASVFLEFMAKSIIHCGDIGSGEIVKVCNNLVLGISMIGVSEAMNLGVSLGMDAKTLASVLSQSTARCWSVDTYNPVPGINQGVPSGNNYNGGFGSDLMKKDLGLAVDAASSSQIPLALGPRALDVYEKVSKAGKGGLDFSVVYDLLKNSKLN